MKPEPLIIGLTCIAALHAPAQEADKAELYRGMLLKRPENAVLFGRFVDAWLAKGEMAGLKEMLEAKAADGGSMDWRLLAVFRNFSGDEAGAITALDEALKKSPDDAQTRLARAKALGAALRFEDAMADLEVAKKDAAVAMEAGTLRGKFLARAGRPADAVKAWVEVIAAHPGDEGLREDLIELEIGEGMLAEAVTAARELAEKTDDPYQKALRRMRVAEILAQAGKKEDAVKEYGEVFAVSAEASWLEREVLARVNALFSREDDAAGLRAFYTQLRETYPRRVVVKKEAARSLMASGEGDEAVSMFREVLKVTPGDRDTRDEFIALLEGSGRFKDAAAEVSALLATADKDAALWEKLAGIRRAMGDEAGLKEAVDKAVTLVPEGEAGSIAAASIYERYDRPEDAEKALRDAVKSHGMAGEAGEALAVMLANRGKPDDAVAIWQEMAKTADREGLMRISRSLTAHGRAADAYKILASRMGEFDGDPLLLAALCQAAQFSDQSDNAIPQSMELVRQARNASDLETALRQAMAIISRSAEPRTHLDALAAKADPSTQELCLLAELHESLGDSIQADKVLKLALASGDPLLAASQRVRLFEMRGDLPSAIGATRDWLALPGGLRTEQVKRLVTLYERSGDNESALKETENWKRIAPGDKLAWIKRAELFTADGQADEAVAELRRALAKFGTDEEMRAKLATSLSEAGLFEESWRMFYSLYDEADSATSKLKWVGLLAEMAAREGKEDDLIADFKRRSRDNPSSVVPLLAMAEMYRTWLLTEEESQVLEEASRRKPDDVSLLQRLADIEEKNGAGDKVEALLNRAIRIQDSPENRRRLSAYWVRNGQPERGLAELLATGGSDPRDIERLVNSLAVAKDWESAAKILAAEAPKNPDDWRLNYLYAHVLRENGQLEEAFERFATLLDAKGDLTGVTPLIPANQMQWMSQGAAGVSNFALFAHLNMLASPKPNQRNYYYGNQLPGVQLPGNVIEVRWMALSQALWIASQNPETRDTKLAGLKSGELKDIDFIKSVQALDADELRERLLADDADPRLFRWYLDTMNYNSNPYRNRGMDIEVMRKGVDSCLKTDPEMALTLMARIPMTGDDALGPERARQMVEIIISLEGKKREAFLPSLLGIAFAEDGDVDKETREKAEAFLLASLNDHDSKQPGQPYFKYSLGANMLRSGRIDEGTALLNGIYQEIRDPARKAQQNRVMTPYGLVSYSQMYGNRSFGELKFPQVMNLSVNQMLQSEFSSANRNGGLAITADQKKLLKLLGEKNSGNPYQGMQRPPVDPELLVKALPSIKDPILRVFMAQCADKPELVATEVESLEKNAGEDAEALQVAAAYRLTIGKDPAAAYQILVRARQFAKDQARDMIDWNLYSLGLKLAADSSDKVDLEDARRAALRLRKPMSLQEDQKRQLATGMTKLGLEEESKRYTAAPKGITGRQSPFRSMGSSGRRQSNEQAVATLVSQGKRDMAARRLLADLRLLKAASNPNSNYEEQQYTRMITSLKLEEEVRKAALPPEGAGFRARRDYAMLLTQLKRQDDALPLLRQLAAEKPDDFEVRTALLLVLPKEEQKEFVLTLSAGDFDADRLGTWFSNLLERGSGRKIEDFLSNMEMLVMFLEKLPPSFDTNRNLSWVNYLTKNIFDNEQFGDIRLRPLGRPANDSGKYDEDRTKERNALANRLYQAMLRHPQTSEQGFILMYSKRDGLEISRESLDASALAAFSLAIRLPQDPEDQNRYGGNRAQMLWTWRTAGGGSRSGGVPGGGLDPLSYLMRPSSDGGGADPFTPEFLSRLEMDAPEQAKSIRSCLAIVNAPGIAAFGEWKESAKKDPDLVSGQLLTIARLAYFKRRTDILDAALDFTCERMVGNAQGGYNGFPGASEVFGMIISSGKDLAARTLAIGRITTGLLGPREGWELYGDANQDQHVYPIQIRMSAFQQLGQSFRGDPSSAVPFARFVAANRLGRLGGVELREALDTRMIRSDAGGSVDNWIGYGLFSPGPDLAGSTQRDGNSIVEQIHEAIDNYGDDTSKKALGAILLKVEGPDRFWARFLGAKVANDPDAAISELNANAAVIMKWPEDSRNDLARLITRWFPDAVKKAGSPVKRLLTESLRKGDTKTRELAMEFLKNGFPDNLQPYSIDESIGSVIQRLIGDDPALAAKVWAKLMDHLQKQQNNGWSSSNNGYPQTASQYANRQFAQSLDRRTTSVPNFARFVFELEKLSPGAGSGMFSQDSSYYIRQLFDNIRSKGKSSFGNDKSLSSLDPSARTCAGILASMTRDTPKEARPLLAAMFLADSSNGSWSINSKALPGLQDWIRKDLRKTDPGMSDAALLMLAPRDEKEVVEADKPALRNAYFNLLTDKTIPAELRVSAETGLSERKASGFWTADAGCVSALADLMVLSASGQPSWGSSNTNDRFMKFANLESLPPADAARVLSAIKGNLPNFSNSGSLRAEASLNKIVVALALRSGDPEAILREVNAAANSLRGDLAFAIRLWQAGNGQAAKALIARPGEYHTGARARLSQDRSGGTKLPAFDRGIESKLNDWLAVIEDPSQRYRVECLIASSPDAKDDEAPQVKRSERIMALSKRFADEAPKPRASRNEVLAALGVEKAAAAGLSGEYLEAVGNQKLGLLLPLRDGNTSTEDAGDISFLTESLIRNVMRGAIENGCDASVFLDQLKSIQPTTSGNQDYYAREMINNLAPEYSSLIVRGIIGLPAEKRAAPAARALEIASLLLEKDNSEIRQTAVALAICSQAAAGNGAALDTWLGAMPKPLREDYEKTRKDRGLTNSMARLKPFYQSNEVDEDPRRALLSAILGDPATMTREIRHMTDITAIMDSGVFSKDDVVAVIDALPESHPRRAEFLTEKAGIIGWHGGSEEEALKAYDVATAAAATDEKMLNFIKAYRVMYLDNRLNLTEDAQVIAKTIQLETLDERERKIVEGILRKSAPKDQKKK